MAVSRIYCVTKVGLSFTSADLDSLPSLVISAEGEVNSGGWQRPELGPWVYIVPPADGILDLDFMAVPPEPGVIVTFGFVTVRAHLVLAIPEWVRGVRVHASTNKLEKMLATPLPSMPMPMGEGMPLPWPFPWYTPQTKGGPSTGGGGY